MLSRQVGIAGNPWANLLRMQREMDRLFETAGPGLRSRVYPPINIYESEQAFLLRAELPGVSLDDLDISVVRNELVLKGQRNAPGAEEGASRHRRERTFGTFARRFALPDNVDGEQVEATYRDGVLELLVPKRPKAAPRQITIHAE